jgi:hypothetical protein
MPSYRAADPSAAEFKPTRRRTGATRSASPSVGTTDVSTTPAATTEAGGQAPYIVPAGRSPLPQPGERFTTPLPARRIGDPAARAVPTLPAGTIIDWTEAQGHVGHHVVVQGKVVSVRRSGEVYFVNFHKDWRGKFYLVIFSDALPGFDQPPDKLLPGKTIQAVGEIKTHRSTPQIQVHDAKQIKVMS